IFGVTVFLIRGKEGLNIDFVGGTAYGGKLVEGKSLEELRQFLGLDDPQRQVDILRVKSVTEVPGSDGHNYDITYVLPLANGYKEQTVYFTNKPEGNTPAERIENVKKRAEQLPDCSVEQVFLNKKDEDKEEESGKSRYFTVRTVEKEAKLV